jgi:predicted GNAT superfamily acetyltransferase
MIKTEMDPQGRSDPDYLMVPQNDGICRVDIVTDPQILEKIIKFDREMFNGHWVGLTVEELTQVAQNGRVFALFGEDNGLIGESAVLLKPTEKHPVLADDEAYCYGTAVLPDVRGKRYAQALFLAQEQTAHRAGKKRITLTLRVENAKSMRSRLGIGYQVNGYDPTRYGPKEDGLARLLMTKDLTAPQTPPNTIEETQRLRSGSTIIVRPNTVNQALMQNASSIAVPIRTGDEVDRPAHLMVSRIFGQQYNPNAQYRGVALLKPEEYQGPAGHSLLVFKRFT